MNCDIYEDLIAQITKAKDFTQRGSSHSETYAEIVSRRFMNIVRADARDRMEQSE